MTSAETRSVAAAVAVVIDEMIRQDQSADHVAAYAAATYRHFEGDVPAGYADVWAQVEEHLGEESLAQIATWVADNADRIETRAATTEVPPVEVMVERSIRHGSPAMDDAQVAAAVAESLAEIAARDALAPLTCSVEAAVFVVDTYVHELGTSLATSIGYYAAVLRLCGRPVPAHHATAVAIAEAELGAELVAEIAAWLRGERGWIEYNAALLDAMRDFEAPALEPIPPEARAAGVVAALLAEAAGDSLAEVILAGACATVLWVTRYHGRNMQLEDIYAHDRPVVNARMWTPRDECVRIATGIRLALAEIDALASGDFRRDSDGSGLDRNDSGGLAGV